MARELNDMVLDVMKLVAELQISMLAQRVLQADLTRRIQVLEAALKC